MKDYKITLSTDKTLKSVDGVDASEVDLALQVWQDLNKLSQVGFLQVEDALVKKMLEQILEIEFNGVSNIPVPDYYDREEKENE